ncbi:MAG: CinA family protein [Candidatus Omnitrophica bacterium]|nr:CinA family protein [Candidatus Omnitrophota bacterium]
MEKLKILVNHLKKRKKTIAVAESMSGGYLSYLLTKISGSSKFFKLGVVAYSLQAKHKLFNIPYTILNPTQGVSEKIAKILSKKVKSMLDTDLGASIVGFAGPKAKKGMRGVVYLGLTKGIKTVTKRKKVSGSREEIRRKASYALIEFILNNLE